MNFDFYNSQQRSKQTNKVVWFIDLFYMQLSWVTLNSPTQTTNISSFHLKKINRGMDRDGSRLLDHRLSTTDLREWKPALDLSASVIHTRASHFAGTKIWNSCQCQCHDEHFREKRVKENHTSFKVFHLC